MAAATQPVPALLTLRQYLATACHPDCDFIDGLLEERHRGGFEHNNLQAALIAWFFTRGPEWNIRVLPEQRTRVRETSVRAVDVCVVPRDGKKEKIRSTPPILCIEILSPEDRKSRTVRVLEDYRIVGVPHLWLFDPIDLLAWTYDSQGLHLVEATQISIPGTPIFVDLPALFASLDDLPSSQGKRLKSCTTRSPAVLHAFSLLPFS